MKLQAERFQTDFRQSSVNDVQSRLLFGHEQHTPPDGQIMRDDVRDRLRFACSGWPVQDKALSKLRIQHCRHLGRIGVHRAIQVHQIQMLVDFIDGKHLHAVVEQAATGYKMIDDLVLP